MEATPFQINYDLNNDTVTPSEGEYAFGGDVTTAYLEMYLRQQFSTTFGVQIATFSSVLIATDVNPISIDFRVKIVFSPSSAFIPTKAEIDMLIALAFLPPQVQTLIDSYSVLPPDLPFSSTQSVEYIPMPNRVITDDLFRSEEIVKNDTGLSATQKGFISVSGAFAFLVFATVILVAARRRSHKRRPLLPFSKHSKFEVIPIMPSYSYCDTRSSNLMRFKDDTRSSTSPDASHQFSLRSKGSSMSSHSSTLSIRAV